MSMVQRRELAVRMVLEGEPPPDVADVLQVSERSVWRWVGTWRKQGISGLATRPGWGRPAKLTDLQASQVLGWLQRSPCEFGFITERWTAPRVAALIDSHLGVRMNHRYLNAWLARRGFTPQVPQRRPRERDEAGIKGWVADRWPLVKKK
jgi:transposase